MIASSFSDFLVALVAASAGIVGGYVAGRMQQTAQRKEREALHEQQRRDRREEDLRHVQDLMEEGTSAAAREVWAKVSGTMPPVEELLHQVVVVSRLRAAVARISDDVLAGHLEDWVKALLKWSSAPRTVGAPEPSPKDFTDATHQVHLRIGDVFAAL